MNFDQAKEFLMSWGLFPNEEDVGDLNEDVVRQGINRKCFGKLLSEAARLHGEKFASFCNTVIDANDDAFYLEGDTWDDIEENWTDLESNDEDYFRIVWAGSKMYYLCSTPQDTAYYLDLVSNEPEVLVLKAEEVYSLGKKV